MKDRLCWMLMVTRRCCCSMEDCDSLRVDWLELRDESTRPEEHRERVSPCHWQTSLTGCCFCPAWVPPPSSSSLESCNILRALHNHQSDVLNNRITELAGQSSREKTSIVLCYQVQLCLPFLKRMKLARLMRNRQERRSCSIKALSFRERDFTAYARTPFCLEEEKSVNSPSSTASKEKTRLTWTSCWYG